MAKATVKCNGKGVWFCRAYLGIDPVTKKPIRKYHSFPNAETEKQAQEFADRWLETLTPLGSPGAGVSLPSLLMLYIDHIRNYGHEPSTVDNYLSIVHAQVVPYLGKIDPDKITPYDIAQFGVRLLAPREQGGRGLKRNSVRKTFSFLSGAFKWLKREKFIDNNPMLEVDYPKYEEHEARFLTPDEYRKLMRTINQILKNGCESGSKHQTKHLRVAAIGARFGLELGSRISEVCAIQKQSINRLTNNLRINRAASETSSAGFGTKSPKRHSVRNIAITEAVLKTASIAEDLLESYGVRVDGETYLVSPDGNLVRPHYLRTWFKKLVSLAGLPDDVTFHTLRHTLASFLIAEGMDLRTVADMLGHSSMAVTARNYAHVMPGRNEAAARMSQEIEDRYS